LSILYIIFIYISEYNNLFRNFSLIGIIRQEGIGFKSATHLDGEIGELSEQRWESDQIAKKSVIQRAAGLFAFACN